MKNATLTILLLLLPAFFFAYGATLPTLDVKVTSASGKVVYKGTTNAKGTFTTGKLGAGNYVVEFDSKAKIEKGSKFALSATAGKFNVSSDSVAGEKFVDPGMAMRVTVAGTESITGMVAAAGSLPKQTQAATNANGKKWNGPTKIVNGKKYIWVRPQTSSLSGGHWVEEGSPEAMEAETNMIQGTQPPARTSGMSGKY